MADARDEELRARYRALATEEPSAALDDAIRAAARRAVASAPGGARRSSTRRWTVPVSLAAVLFLSFGVVMHMQQETPTVEAELRGAPPPARPQPSQPQPSPQAPPPKAELEIARDKPSEVAIEPTPRKEKKVAEPPPAARPAPAAPAPVPPGSAPPAPAAAAAPAAPAVQAAPLMKQEVAKEATPPTQDAGKRDAAPARAASAPAPQPFSDTASPPRPALEERNVAPSRREDEVGGAAAGSAASRAKTESLAAKRVEAAPSASAASPALRAQGRIAASSVDRLAPWPDTPEKKLERIEELRKAGRDSDADEAIARFKREHPDYRIPEDLWNRIKPR